MVQLQIISKVLSTQSITIIEDNLLSVEYFVGYEDEYNFIMEHNSQYGNVPDRATFLSKFPEIELVEVTESDKYLVDTIQEEYLYYKSVPIVQKAAELLKSDANAASEYMISAIKDLQPNYLLGGINIISDANIRLQEFKERKEHQNDWFFTTGFQELDELTHGLARGEELCVIFARTNQGKSWVLEKIVTHIWQIGFNVGYISPEMSSSSVGYRFDTLYKNFSNSALMWGKDAVSESEYELYTNELSTHSNKFMVATPIDFNKTITVTKLKNWVKRYKLDLLAVDGIKYLTDERAKRGDSMATALTNISEDLFLLSMELRIPVIVVVQANRTGYMGQEQKGTPEVESIKDSDGISHNASKVFSIRQLKEGILEIGIKKQRFGPVGGKLDYHWNIDIGDFQFIPSYDDAEPMEQTNRKVEAVRKKFNDKEDVF